MSAESGCGPPRMNVWRLPVSRRIRVVVVNKLPNGDVITLSLAEDGEELAWHSSPSEERARHDMGVTSTQNHELYRAKYPGAFEVVWSDEPDPRRSLP